MQTTEKYTYTTNALEIADAINEAVENDEYLVLEKLAKVFAEDGDEYNAHWLRGLAHTAYLNAWGYDSAVDNGEI